MVITADLEQQSNQRVLVTCRAPATLDTMQGPPTATLDTIAVGLQRHSVAPAATEAQPRQSLQRSRPKLDNHANTLLLEQQRVLAAATAAADTR